MKRTNIHLTEDEIKNLDKISERSELKKAELIRRAVDDFIENYKIYGLTIKGITGVVR
jgi:metal-responsive CopG/Arc/MetJ family transcriptional regulator